MVGLFLLLARSALGWHSIYCLILSPRARHRKPDRKRLDSARRKWKRVGRRGRHGRQHPALDPASADVQRVGASAPVGLHHHLVPLARDDAPTLPDQIAAINVAGTAAPRWGIEISLGPALK